MCLRFLKQAKSGVDPDYPARLELWCGHHSSQLCFQMSHAGRRELCPLLL
jgi:hypothetical protein